MGVYGGMCVGGGVVVCMGVFVWGCTVDVHMSLGKVRYKTHLLNKRCASLHSSLPSSILLFP